MENIPQFVKVKAGYFCEENMTGKILDTTKPFPKYLQYCEDVTWKKIFDNPDRSKHFQSIETIIEIY